MRYARRFGGDEPLAGVRRATTWPAELGASKMPLAIGSSYNDCVTFASSARKHGVLNADIEHAMKHATRIEYQDDRRWLYLGASRSGKLLEVVKVVGPERVIHAMPAKPTRALARR